MVYKKYKNKEKTPNLNNTKKNIDNDNQSIASESYHTELDNNIDDSIMEKKGEETEKRQFESIKDDKEFKDLIKKENSIRLDFHVNRDVYNFIRGISNDIGRAIDSR